MENYDNIQTVSTSNTVNENTYGSAAQPNNNINIQSAVKAALSNISITKDALQEAAAMEQNEVSKDTNEKNGDDSFENR
jgi:hypothetical protein